MSRVSRRHFLAGLGAAPLLRAAPRPNIVFILADDLGAGDLSSFGATNLRTPRIDSIGRAGMRFTRCYANAPECSPTRTALLTGRYQQRVGGLECAIGVGNVGRYDEAVWLQKRGQLGLPAGEITMPKLLKQAGYDTAIFGKWHLGYEKGFLPPHHGFDESFGVLGGNANYFTHTEEDGARVLHRNGEIVERKGYLTDLFGGEAVRWLGGRSKQKPFFLYLPFTAPHTPIQGPDDAGKPLAEWNGGDKATYAKMIERMDFQVGRVLDELDRRGFAENTIVLFTSDNGGVPRFANNRGLRGGKSFTWEGGLRVPGLLRWPGLVKPGSETGQVALTMDFTVSFLAAAGAAPPKGHQFDGADLREVFAGRRAPLPRTVFWRYKRAENRRKAVLDGTWKYVYDSGKEELHDSRENDLEKNDVLARQPQVAEALRAKLAAWEKEVEAPRLKDFPR